MELVEAYAESENLENFRWLLNGCRRWHTRAEEDYEKLEPWIQWVTAHTGKTFAEVGFEFTQASSIKDFCVRAVLLVERFLSTNLRHLVFIGGLYSPTAHPPEMFDDVFFFDIFRRMAAQGRKSGRKVK